MVLMGYKIREAIHEDVPSMHVWKKLSYATDDWDIYIPYCTDMFDDEVTETVFELWLIHRTC